MPDPGSVLLLPGFGSTIAADFSFVGPMLGRTRTVIGVETGEPLPEGAAPMHVVGYGAGAAAATIAVAQGRVAALTVTLIAPVLASPVAPSPATAPGTAMPDLLSPAFRALRPEVSAPRSDPERAAAELAALADVDLVALIASVDVPVLVIRCTDDALAGPTDAARLVDAAPDARLALVDSGHAVLVERPAEVLALLAPFLADPHGHAAGSVIRAVAA
jgi:pimeloyl-ACP methyl ester carboxylesterase